jgi:hypothetical protein
VLAQAYDQQEIMDLLCNDVEKMNPSSPEELQRYMLSAAKTRAERLEKQFTEMQKRSAVAQATFQSTATEPPIRFANSHPIQHPIVIDFVIEKNEEKEKKHRASGAGERRFAPRATVSGGAEMWPRTSARLRNDFWTR